MKLQVDKKQAGKRQADEQTSFTLLEDAEITSW